MEQLVKDQALVVEYQGKQFPDQKKFPKDQEMKYKPVDQEE